MLKVWISYSDISYSSADLYLLQSMVGPHGNPVLAAGDVAPASTQSSPVSMLELEVAVRKRGKHVNKLQKGGEQVKTKISKAAKRRARAATYEAWRQQIDEFEHPDRDYL